MNGLDRLVRRLKETDGPVGLLSHQTLPTADALHAALGNRLTVLFSPEHGWCGLAGPGEKTGDDRHPFYGVPVRSLYGEHRRPSADDVAPLSRIVVDLQDLGVRCYTYLATLRNMLAVAAGTHVPVTVFDRPVPLGGIVDGPMREDAFDSFVAPLNVPLCHGMTPGEAAVYIRASDGLDLELDIVRPHDRPNDALAPWPNFAPPSPGIPSWDSAVLYPATLFTEAFPAVDCDRAGPLSFRVLGAPGLDAAALVADTADALAARGVGIRPYRYRPAHGTYAGQTLDGILLSIGNTARFRPVEAGTLLYAAVAAQWNGIDAGARSDWFDKLNGTSSVREAVAQNRLDALFADWRRAHAEWLAQRPDLHA